jgi:hypothetical protein
MTEHVLRLPFSLEPLMAEAKRRARQRRVLVMIVALAVLGGGGAGAAIAFRSAKSLTPASKAIDIAAIEKLWLSHLRQGARLNPDKRFASPAKAVLLRRLQGAAARYHFTLVRAQLIHPEQAAPLVVVQTQDEHALAASVPAILRFIDPRTRTGREAYEGLLFEARNTNGVLFLATYEWWRTDVGGGQSASSQSLFPFAHG